MKGATKIIETHKDTKASRALIINSFGENEYVVKLELKPCDILLSNGGRALRCGNVYLLQSKQPRAFTLRANIGLPVSKERRICIAVEIL
jgi:hypothetical protein